MRRKFVTEGLCTVGACMCKMMHGPCEMLPRAEQMLDADGAKSLLQFSNGLLVEIVMPSSQTERT